MILCSEIFHNKKLESVLKDLNEIDKLLPEKNSYKKIMMFSIFSLIFTTIITLPDIIIYILPGSNGKSIRNFVKVFTLFWTPAIALLFKFRFVGLCCLIYCMFKRLNNYLILFTKVYTQVNKYTEIKCVKYY